MNLDRVTTFKSHQNGILHYFIFIIGECRDVLGVGLREQNILNFILFFGNFGSKCLVFYILVSWKIQELLLMPDKMDTAFFSEM